MTKLRGFLLGGLILWMGLSAQGQIRFTPGSNNYFEVKSYLGVETHPAFSWFQFDINGKVANIENWSIGARVRGPITPGKNRNKSGKPFPVDKISFRWTTDNFNKNINLNSIPAGRNYFIYQNANDVYLINKSKVALRNYDAAEYTQIYLYGALKIDAGKYLDEYLNIDPYSPIAYDIPVIYTLYDERGNVLGSNQIVYIMQLDKSLTDGHLVDVEPDYSLEIMSEASNASLIFTTADHYKNGRSTGYPNAVKVNSISNFELQVKSMNNDLTDNMGNTLDLSIMSVELSAGDNAAGATVFPKAVLSTNAQKVVDGRPAANKKKQSFNLEYKAQFTPQQIRTLKPGKYETSLLYMLMPK